MTNVDKLKGAIKEKRLTPEKVAESIGIDKSTMYRKLSNGGEDFTIKQADAITQILGLTGDEAQAIFFSQDCQCTLCSTLSFRKRFLYF